MTTSPLSVEDAHSLARAALIAANTSPENAESTARALVRAEVDGQGGHGLSRVPSYAGQARVGKVRGHATPSVEVLRPGAIRVDAGHGFAYPAFDLAFPELIARAGDNGIAAAAIHRSHHFGVAGHHCETLADAGLVAFVYGNSPKAMAPWGAKTPVLGTNPVAFAAPIPGQAPLVIDMAVTNVARGKILAAREIGEPIPEGWAFGPDGQPTTDAAVALKGTMAPMGGAKGAAIALMVEVMSACLAGAAFGTEASSLFEPEGEAPNLGQTILALDPEVLSGGAFGSRMTDIAALYAELEGARLPGLRRLEARRRVAEQGLTVKTALLEQLKALANA